MPPVGDYRSSHSRNVSSSISDVARTNPRPIDSFGFSGPPYCLRVGIEVHQLIRVPAVLIATVKSLFHFDGTRLTTQAANIHSGRSSRLALSSRQAPFNQGGLSRFHQLHSRLTRTERPFRSAKPSRSFGS